MDACRKRLLLRGLALFVVSSVPDEGSADGVYCGEVQPWEIIRCEGPGEARADTVLERQSNGGGGSMVSGGAATGSQRPKP